MSIKYDSLPTVKLYPKNKLRLDAILRRYPILSMAKAVNMVLDQSLARFEKNADWISKTPPTK